MLEDGPEEGMLSRGHVSRLMSTWMSTYLGGGGGHVIGYV